MIVFAAWFGDASGTIAEITHIRFKVTTNYAVCICVCVERHLSSNKDTKVY